jgi:hypothetical protein
MEEDGLMFGGMFCFFDIYCCCFWREILTVDVKVKKVILKSFIYCLKLGFFRLIFGLGQQGGKICLWTYCLLVGGFRKFLHIKFYLVFGTIKCWKMLFFTGF